MFIDWQSPDGEWKSIPQPSFFALEKIYYRLNQLMPLVKGKSLSEAYDTDNKVEFLLDHITSLLGLNPEEAELSDLEALLISPGYILPKIEPGVKGKKKKTTSNSRLIASIWLASSMADTLLLLNNFSHEQALEILEARSELVDPEGTYKRKAQLRAKDSYKDTLAKNKDKIKSLLGKKRNEDKEKKKAKENIKKNLLSRKPKNN